jgi:hypothetical protein
MHGLNTAPEVARNTAFAPRTALWHRTDRCSGESRRRSPSETSISARPFTRPPRRSISEPPLRGHRSRPTPSILCRAGFRARSASDFPPRVAGRIYAQNPLPGSLTQPSRASSSFRSPFGFSAVRIAATARFHQGGLPWTSRSISVRSPTAFDRLRPPQDHRSRSATSRQARWLFQL